MADVVVFPSVLGVRPGVLDLVARLREAGHVVWVHDQVGQVYDDYAPAVARNDSVPIDEQFAFARDAVAELPAGGYVIGFSAGGALAEHAAARRTDLAGCVVLGGGLPVHWLDVAGWPSGTALQLHQCADDPWREDGANEEAVADVTAAGAAAASYTYPGSGHLFFDASLPDEYDATSAAAFMDRLQTFLSTGRP